MKTAVVLLALVAMVASQVQVADYNPDLVQVGEYNPEQVNVVDNNGQVVDPAFGRPGGFNIDPAFGRPGNGAELINKEPAIVYPPGSRPQYPKRYDNPAWRGGGK